MPKMRVNGFEMHYVLDDYTDPWVPHETVFMHHGFARSHRWFYGWVPTLARRYKIVRFDARGQGESQTPPWGFRWSLEGLADDVLALEDALGLDKVHYIGESLGGLVGATLAAAHPDRLWSLVLCATPPVPQPGLVPGYASRMAALRALGHWGTSALPPGDTAADKLRSAWILTEYQRTPLQLGLAREEMMKLASTDITELLPRIKVPTLLMSGGRVSRDRLAAQDMMERRIPNCRRIRFEDAGYYLCLEYPEQCALAALELFVEQDRKASIA